MTGDDAWAVLRQEDAELRAWYRALLTRLDPEERSALGDQFDELLDVAFDRFEAACEAAEEEARG
jgi:hypothetical protein